MGKKRIYELAKELEMSNTDLVQKAQAIGLLVQNHMTALEAEDAMRLRRAVEQDRRGHVVEKRIGAGIIRRRAKKEELEEQVKSTVAASQAGGATARPVAPTPPPPREVHEPEPARPAAAGDVVSLDEARERREVHVPPTPEAMPQVAASAAATAGASAPVVASAPVSPVVAQPGKPATPTTPPPVTDDRLKKKVSTKQELSRRDLYEIKRDLMMGTMRPAKKKKPTKAARKTEITTPKAAKRVVRISDSITVGDLAKRMSVKAGEVIMKLMGMGMMTTLNQAIDTDTATLVAHEFGWEIEKVAFEEETLLEEQHDREEELKPRPPVVTIMGHVDHGKTSLLDRIRKSRVAEGEAGGITQHIGAYRVPTAQGDVAFLDTPGHEAFTAMRARGAMVTDLVVLVVAADDGVMPQTEEAIRHAREADVPIMVAVNKIDKQDADPMRVRQDLTKFELVPEEWGGETIFVDVSARTGDGVPQLLEMIALQSEVLELRANPDKRASGAVVEAKLEKGRGPVATVLVREGTLRVGDYVVTGVHHGRVRAMLDDMGRQLPNASPSIPAEVLGLDGVPTAGDSFNVVADEKQAKAIAEHRQLKAREAALAKSAKVSLADLDRMIAEGDLKELKVIVKADVQGSAEAVTEALNRLATTKVKVRVIHSAVGGITESDVMLAAASNALIVGFNVRPDSKVQTIAEQEKVEIRAYSIIYELIDEVKKAMAGLLAPVQREQVLGRAEVRQTFTVPKIGTIAGCAVISGKVTRSSLVRLLRDNVVVFTGRVGSLRRFKDDAREVLQGYECGIGIDGYNDVKPGDVIEAYEIQEVAAELPI
jgi:translation initiation factor IF-2